MQVCAPESPCPSPAPSFCEPVRERSPVEQRKRGLWRSRSPRVTLQQPVRLEAVSPDSLLSRVSTPSTAGGRWGPGRPAGGLHPGVGFGTRQLPQTCLPVAPPPLPG